MALSRNDCVFFFSSRRRHTRLQGDWSSDVCSSDLGHDEAWLILTDLPAGAANPAWYALRMWIEQGFKSIKSGCWQWQHTRMQDAQRGSGERRGGEEGRSRGVPGPLKKKKKGSGGRP